MVMLLLPVEASVILSAAYVEIFDPLMVAFIEAVPEVVAVKTDATIPLASVVSVAGVK
jgi:hypothetical protein